LSIKKAADFASKMNREKQHTFYKCCRIAADYYGVSASDVQKELASRAGTKANGRKYKHVVVYRVPKDKVTYRDFEYQERKREYFVNKPKTTTNPQKIIKDNKHECIFYGETCCEVFDNLKDANEFYLSKIKEMEEKIIVLKSDALTKDDADRLKRELEEWIAELNSKSEKGED